MSRDEWIKAAYIFGPIFAILALMIWTLRDKKGDK